MYKRYQTLLLGNGLNRSFDGNSWNDVLEKITIRNDIPKELDCPLPLKAILCTNDSVKEAIKGKKDDFFGRVTSSDQMGLLQEVLSTGFDDIITTNYSYELEISSLGESEIKEKQLKEMSRHTAAVIQVEGKYLLHSYNIVTHNGFQNHIWHIHGEARKPDSIILGHYYYANLLGKMTDYFKDNKNRYERSLKSKSDLEKRSWLDPFILGDVYVLGFSFGFSEFDLWWLLNRKKREKAPHGKVYFFEPKSSEFDARIELLKLLDVEYYDCEFTKPEEKASQEEKDQLYRAFYPRAFAKIQELRQSHLTSPLT